jgi:hypothetical protein
VIVVVRGLAYPRLGMKWPRSRPRLNCAAKSVLAREVEELYAAYRAVGSDSERRQVLDAANAELELYADIDFEDEDEIILFVEDVDPESVRQQAEWIAGLPAGTLGNEFAEAGGLFRRAYSRQWVLFRPGRRVALVRVHVRCRTRVAPRGRRARTRATRRGPPSSDDVPLDPPPQGGIQSSDRGLNPHESCVRGAT